MSHHDAIPPTSEGSPADEDGEEDLTDTRLEAMLGMGGAVRKSGHAWRPPSVEEVQRLLPQYEVTAFVARGGMGAVYKGVQKSLHRTVAIKVLPPEVEHDDLQYAERFKREAEAMAGLSHPNIVSVFDAGETPSSTGSGKADGLLYFIMEFVEGTDVQQLIAHEGKVEPARALSITAAVCDALAFAHEEGIIHRDIKPSNVMIDKRGRVKVADFGLAKVITHESGSFTRSDLALGTADFIAPEAMIPGAKVDARADVYAVGVMLYQMLTGKIPRGSFDPPSGVVEQIDPCIDAIVLKAMKTDREKRYASAAEMKAAVEAVFVGQALRLPELAPSKSGQADSSSAVAPLRRTERPRYKEILAIGAAILVIAVSVFFLLKKEPPSAQTVTGVPGQISSPAPTSQAGTSGNAAFAPGKWIKTTAKQWQPLKDGPDFRGNGEMKLGGAVVLADLNVAAVAIRGKVRLPAGSRYTFVHLRSLKNETRDERRTLSMRRNPGKPDSWSLQVNLKGKHDDVGPEPQRSFDEMADADGWINFEFGVAAATSFARLGNHPWIRQTDTNIVSSGSINLSGDSAVFKDLEILNLDGLPEAEALKLAGVDAAANVPLPQWHDALAESPLKDVIANADHNGQGWLLPPGNHWPVTQLLRAGAIRIRGTWEGEGYPLFLESGMDDGGRYVKSWVGSGGLAKTVYVNHPQPDQVLAQKEGVAITAGRPHEMTFARIAGTFWTLQDGQTILQAADPDATPARLILDCGHDRKFRVEKVEYINLDGLPEAEALKLAGVTGKTAAPPAAAWRRVDFATLDDARLLQAAPGIAREGDVLHLKNNRVFTAPGTKVRDGAVRAVLVWSKDSAWTPRVTTRMGAGKQYHLTINHSSVDLDFYNDAPITLKTFHLAAPLREGEEVLVQLASIGHRHFAWVNGTLLGSVEDGQFDGAGELGIQANDARFKSMEWLPLDGLPEAEALKLVGVSESLKPSPSSAWQDVLHDPAALALQAGAERTDEGLRFTKAGAAYLRQGLRHNGAIRMRAKFGDIRLVLRARKTEGLYELSPGDGKAIILRRATFASSQTNLGIFPLSQPLQSGQDYELELRIVGGHLTALCNGAILGTATDATYTEGEWGIGTAQPEAAPTLVKTLEVLNLDGLTESEALKLTGLTSSLTVPISLSSSVLTFGGHRYQFVPGSLTWTEAKAKAEAMGGHLATLTSKEECQAVYDLCRKALPKQTPAPGQPVRPHQAWLGATRAKDADWTWLTGEPFAYTDWNPFHSEDRHAAYGLTVMTVQKPDEDLRAWNGVLTTEKEVPHIAGFLVEWDDDGKSRAK